MFRQYVAQLFHAMADVVMSCLKIPYFNGRLFENVQAEALLQLANAANLNWASIEPAIFGTLFEHSLDPPKRAQLGAHYTVII
ncbi:MAG: hypothetical protein MUF87_13470 [Anaerolineae bacterium]|jgi:hypothetical protein|nr:hypothetical protein [Anaerolineae bacterium]